VSPPLTLRDADEIRVVDLRRQAADMGPTVRMVVERVLSEIAAARLLEASRERR